MPKGYALSEAEKDRIWELRALGLSERKIGHRLGLAPKTVRHYLAKVGGIRPRRGRRAARCLTLDEREEISRGIAGGHSAREIARTLGRSHTTIAREIDRCGGRRWFETTMQSVPFFDAPTWLPLWPAISGTPCRGSRNSEKAVTPRPSFGAFSAPKGPFGLWTRL